MSVIYVYTVYINFLVYLYITSPFYATIYTVIQTCFD